MKARERRGWKSTVTNENTANSALSETEGILYISVCLFFCHLLPSWFNLYIASFFLAVFPGIFEYRHSILNQTVAHQVAARLHACMREGGKPSVVCVRYTLRRRQRKYVCMCVRACACARVCEGAYVQFAAS